MTELLFIRHGQTDYNVQQRFQGQVDPPLNAAGQEQARRLGTRLAGDRYDALVASDLLRTRQTAAPLAAAWATAPALMPGLREQSFGVLEGLDAPTIRERHPDLWARWLEQRADYALPGGESNHRFHARVLQAVRDIARELPGRRVAVVTHGGVLDMLWRTAHGLPLEGHRTCEIPNTGLNRLRWVDGRLEIDAWADDAHLRDVEPAITPPAG